MAIYTTWFAELRQAAEDQAATLPLPTPDKTKITNWNFTPKQTKPVDEEVFTSLEAAPGVVRALVDMNKSVHNLYVQKNNIAAFTTLTEEASKQGVIFSNMIDAMMIYPDLVKKYYMCADGIRVDSHKLAALNTALLNGGVFVYVPENVVVADPLQAIFMTDRADVSLYHHVIIVAEAHAKVTYVENYISTVESDEQVANLISEVYVGAHAEVTYGAVDTLNAGVTTFVHRTAYVGEHGKMEWALGLMNYGNTVSENVTLLKGDDSYADSKTVVVGNGVQKQNFTTNIIHTGKRSNGMILKHGVMKDETSSIFNGIGHIKHGATGSNAEQTSRVLMLDKTARGDANPILLIDEDDVTAGHAASAGRVDEMQLYYLMSRGIPRKEAERLVIHGFLAPVMQGLAVEQVQKQLVDVIEAKINS